MKGLISANGVLHIERKGRTAEALCPFDRSDRRAEDAVACGDWCALFHEPITRKATTELPLCHKILVFNEFQDLR